MAKFTLFSFVFMASIISVTMFSSCSPLNGDERKVHIVYMGSLTEEQSEYSPTSHHLSILQEVLGDGISARKSLVRSYKRSINGFAAKLTDQERQNLALKKGVVSVFPSRMLHPQTTRSWDFMGLTEKAKRETAVEGDTIIGVIDTGIWPESESFTDEGFGPPPKKWKGACEGGQNFTCNNKLIGARYYVSFLNSTRDTVGHGSHTASTAAGNNVNNANFYGIARGIARGGVPSARIAAYAVCYYRGCGDVAILAAFDDAIADGVDIITVSLGFGLARDVKEDSIAIGSFHAMERGILTLHSAGNDGPNAGTVSSVAPWLLTVAANTIDRRIIDKVVLGNGKTLIGNSVNSFSSNGKKFPIVYGKSASRTCPEFSAKSCDINCIDKELAKGKIVLCSRPSGAEVAFLAGAIGSIELTNRDDNVSYVVPFPVSAINSTGFVLVESYLNSTKNPQAEILKSEAVNDTAAPRVAFFSSRGPNSLIPEILKPDISAPGVDILAAFSPVVSPSNRGQDKRSVKYSIMSGTSMSSPHVAGIAAYVKTFHPDWSPSAIKSAIMTTAHPMNIKDGEFASGAGHVNPLGAIHPGLVYNASKEDYIQLLCNFGYNTTTVRSISGDNSTCPIAPKKSSLKDHNYPALAAEVLPLQPFKIKFNRTVTNVGRANSTYKVKVLANSKLNIRVAPEVLSFKSLKEKQSFVVTVVGGKIKDNTVLSSSLVWSDGNHSVRSPIVVNINSGNARGGVPSARIAAYAVCNDEGCTDEAILAAFDDAIADGVDIITLSLGSRSISDIKEDSIAIGSFHAMERGILTINSAGNYGPDAGSVSSVAPWMLTVAANTIDRRIIDKVVLGNGRTLTGNSVNSFKSNGKKIPMVFGKSASRSCPESSAKSCDTNCVDRELAKGKIVLCTESTGAEVALLAGAIGSITMTHRVDNVSFVVPFPVSPINSKGFALVESYLNSTKNPQAEILKSEAVNDTAAPRVADFSSRGPNSIIPEILKPDISAPGVDILAAYSPMVSPSNSGLDKRSVKYNILSGTSMSCPHVAGIAAYVKTFHPDWSPSAIKSAIMTTAHPMNIKDGEFAFGAGQVNPLGAIHPGLVYNASKGDYIQLLCNFGYNTTTVRSISGDNSTCPKAPKKSSLKDHNYPALAAEVLPLQPFKIKFNRTVTNVGLANSTYNVRVLANSKLNITVAPEVLSFKSLKEKQSFVVHVVGGKIKDNTVLSSSLVWSDGSHSVRSPIVVNINSDDKILAAFDVAIADEVDIITVSLGGAAACDIKEDLIAIGSFHAIESGILTINSAGNDGPKVPMQVQNQVLHHGC
ncbi:Subtilisin-like protease [Quillaja saponaria]|uniref:Subtilisin-like protease n=1 Tax=Quillaja saponaria TaxID=32244 RepID=A0AAD7LLZ6_QUISA|nr:Subtilisin-like protease [Quillaja saponaria]